MGIKTELNVIRKWRQNQNQHLKKEWAWQVFWTGK